VALRSSLFNRSEAGALGVFAANEQTRYGGAWEWSLTRLLLPTQRGTTPLRLGQKKTSPSIGDVTRHGCCKPLTVRAATYGQRSQCVYSRFSPLTVLPASPAPAPLPAVVQIIGWFALLSSRKLNSAGPGDLTVAQASTRHFTSRCACLGVETGSLDFPSPGRYGLDARFWPVRVLAAAEGNLLPAHTTSKHPQAALAPFLAHYAAKTCAQNTRRTMLPCWEPQSTVCSLHCHWKWSGCLRNRCNGLKNLDMIRPTFRLLG